MNFSYSNAKVLPTKTASIEPLPVATALPVLLPVLPSSFTDDVFSCLTQKPAEMTPSLLSKLSRKGLTKGLAMALRENALIFPLRVWLIDNSGSMYAVDGHRIVQSRRSRKIEIVEATRWEQVLESVNYHTEMASMINAPSIFRLLNANARVPEQQFTVALNGHNDKSFEEAANARSLLSRVSPAGLTPLAEQIDYIRNSIVSPMMSQLQSTGRKVSVIIATDGLPTDKMGRCNKKTHNEFVQALKSLGELPVWIVIRLCTDVEEVVDFYKEIDRQLEFSLEILSDYICEAEDVYEHNRWINYGLPLHRCRELGFDNRLFELMNERALTKGEIQQFCSILFGEDFENYNNRKIVDLSDSYEDFDGFLCDIDRIMMESSKISWNQDILWNQDQFNPITKKVEPWINTRILRRGELLDCEFCQIL